jgi:hypothetical protein
MQIKTTVFALALTIAASGTLFASEIYKRIDSDGNVSFSDRPTVGAEQLSIWSRPTDPERVQTRVQSRVDDQAVSAERKANAPQGPTAEELRAEARDRDEKCSMYRARQVEFTRNRRIYKMEDGERVYYDEAEMQAARSGVDDQVQQYCN